MDTSAMAASVFGGLPYFNPMMMINTSGTCAATRLIQCRDFGTSMNDISRKFDKPPEASPDLGREDFFARKIILAQVRKWCEDNVDKNEWTPILYMFEIVKTTAKREKDWGHLVFTDGTLTRFLLVMVFPSACNCENFSHHDFGALTKYHADRFMSLLKYIYHDGPQPNWVRATYTTQKHQFKVDPVFLSSHDPPSIPKHANAEFPPIIHVTANTFTPSLLASDLEKIDNLRAQRGEAKPVPQRVRDAVTGSKETKPDVSSVWKQRVARGCAHCEKAGEKNLSRCSRCKLVQYCGRECQKLAWPTHKLVCKKA